MSTTVYGTYVWLSTWWADTAPRRREDRGEGVISAAIAVHFANNAFTLVALTSS